MASIKYSRSLYLPGPVPPMTHLGITLQRHCVVSGLRYTLYHLGFPVAEKAPIRIFQLRLYLDADALSGRMEGAPGSREILGALLDPRGKLPISEQAGEVAAAALFHRLRLSAVRRKKPPEIAEPADGATAWKLFRAGVSRWLNRLNDAFLTDTLVARSRRRRRAEKKPVTETLPREAWRFRAGKTCRLDHLGGADLFTPSWDEDRESRDQARALLEDEPVPARDVRRGLFRETYRGMLSHLRPSYLTLAQTAVERGFIDHPDEAFFLPFDLVGDLAGSQKPEWLDEAVRSNRQEYEACSDAQAPDDQLEMQPNIVLAGDPAPEQSWNCVLPIL